VSSVNLNKVARSKGPRSRSKGRRASAIDRRRISASRSIGEVISRKSTTGRAIVSAGTMIWNGCPLTHLKTVRKDSWHLMSSLKLCSRASTLRGPRSSVAEKRLYAGLPGSSWSMNHKLCWAKEGRRSLSREAGRIENISAPSRDERAVWSQLARAATVGVSKKLLRDNSTCKSSRICEITRIANRESPPRSKKLS